MEYRLNRRTFLMGAAGLALAPTVARAASTDKVRIGVIGVGGQGEFSWSSLADQEIVMLCDVDLARTAKAKQTFPNAEVVQDFRRVIDRNDIEAVVVATPDHWHAIPSVWAMQSGKHVYCEKPLAHSVHECRVVEETARKHNRVTQMGTQIHAGSNYRRVVELVKAGAIGTVRKVDVWCDRQPEPGHRSSTGIPPSTLDYKMWVGPAEYRPYDPNIVPFHWRWWWEFGGGVLADMACPFMDLPHWALDLRYPERVSATGTQFPNADNTVPVEMRVEYSYPSRGSQPPVHLTWWHGTSGPRDEQGHVRNVEGFRSGVLFHGTEGELVADYGSHKLLPEAKYADYKRPEPTIPDSIGHHKEWINAIRNGGPTTCNFEYSGALAETVNLGNVAFRLGREIEWNARRERITNVRREEWEPLIQPEYHNGWKLRG
jgi:predicted dehydrogenase